MAIFNITDVDPAIERILADQLDEVARLFERQLASEFESVNGLCMHVERYRGKMLRPTLVLLSGMASRDGSIDHALTETHRTIAAVTEMIHMATLVHDDVLDESTLRRGGTTLNQLHGSETAVMLGDYLISNAFHLCSSLGRPELNLGLGSVTNTLCEGEIVQLHHRGDLTLDEDTYLQIITRKTASLVGSCCELGAMLSDANPSVVSALRTFGIKVGVAFQVTDDLLDLTGDQAEVGKSVGRDLDMGKLTLPLIRALDQGADDERRIITALIEDRCRAQLRDHLHEHGWIDSTASTAADLISDAQRQLAHVPDNAATRMLHQLADGILPRRH